MSVWKGNPSMVGCKGAGVVFLAFTDMGATEGHLKYFIPSSASMNGETQEM